jgi:hypothetical protein
VRCETCGAEAALQWRPGAEVVVGTVAGVLDRRPVLACASGHVHAAPGASDAASAAVDDQLPQARRRWRRGDACVSCRAGLDLPVRRTRRSITVTPIELAVHTLHLDVPMTRCGDCGTDQVPTRSGADLHGVVAAAYRPDEPTRGG